MDCAPSDFEDTSSSDVIETDDAEVSLDSVDDSSGGSSATSADAATDDDATWSDTESSDDADDCGDSGAGSPTVAASTETGDDATGDHCAPAATHPSLGDPSPSDPSSSVTSEPDTSNRSATTSSPSATPAAASAGSPLLALPDHIAPGATIGSSEGAQILTSGTFTPTSFDANGNATHVSYSGIIQPSTTMANMGGNQTMPASDHPQVLAIQNMVNQTNHDMIMNTLTGVTIDRSGSSPTFYGGGKPFDDFGDALGNERDPQP